MALSEAQLVAAIRAAIAGKQGDVLEEVIKEILDHIKAQAVVELKQALIIALNTSPVTPADGGATLKTFVATALQSNPNAGKIS